jgi:hypothetical protein
MAMPTHSPLICLQQARSAGFRCALGRAHTIVGASNGNSTATINANWRTAFMPASTLHPHPELYKVSSLRQVWAQVIFTHVADAGQSPRSFAPQIFRV